jgi:Cof subfamily protein (haloacid dehalogenase superfamily)
MAIKLIITDIDGTLLNRNREVTPRTANAIKRAKDRGVLVTLASGRTMKGVGAYLQYASPGVPVIVYNGAILVNSDSLEPLFERCLDARAVREIWARGQAHGMAMVVWKRTELFVNRLDGPMQYYRNLSFAMAQVTSDPGPFIEGANKMIWVHDGARVSAALEDLKVRPVANANWFTSEPIYLEFAPSGVSKGAGLLLAGEFCGIEPAEIMAVGDEMNDLPMLECAGLGVAMGNAPEAVRRAADTVTAPCEEDGLALAIERYVLSQM